MIFNSIEFLIFFPVVFFIYAVLPHKFQNIFLLLSSYFFYGFWDWRFLSLLGISTLVDFICGLRISETHTKKSEYWLYFSLFTNLTLLGFFKYFNFFTESFLLLISRIGISVESTWSIEILLPVGISFYTFQSMAYTIDVHRGKIAPCSKFLDFALYISYFPQLVAGPIERASRLLPQISHERKLSWKKFTGGFDLILIGLFKKIVIGDFIASHYVEASFTEPTLHSGVFLMMGLCLFSIQIYVDFSGYSDIARGLSRMLGIELIHNFKQPYISKSITEFWRRWHISLSGWLKDYLYISLGGNRLSRRRTYINLIITMLIGGLWHGASWNFVLWGLLHGIYLAIHKFYLRGRKLSINLDYNSWSRVLEGFWGIILTNVLVLFAWVFFRSKDLSLAFEYLLGMRELFTSKDSLLGGLLVFGIYIIFIVSSGGLFYQFSKDSKIKIFLNRFRLLIKTTLILSIWVFWPTNYKPFIYFQF